jgi:hypothetical protein
LPEKARREVPRVMNRLLGTTFLDCGGLNILAQLRTQVLPLITPYRMDSAFTVWLPLAASLISNLHLLI